MYRFTLHVYSVKLFIDECFYCYICEQHLNQATNDSNRDTRPLQAEN